MEIDPEFENDFTSLHQLESNKTIETSYDGGLRSPQDLNIAHLAVRRAEQGRPTQLSSFNVNVNMKANSDIYAQNTGSGNSEDNSILSQHTAAPEFKVKLVEYDPNSKPERLGRPRKHITKPSSPPETSSAQNHNEALISKFRFDNQPLEGPGSRGGKTIIRVPKGKLTSSARKRKHQSTLNFSPIQHPKLNETKKDEETANPENFKESKVTKETDESGEIEKSKEAKEAKETGNLEALQKSSPTQHKVNLLCTASVKENQETKQETIESLLHSSRQPALGVSKSLKKVSAMSSPSSLPSLSPSLSTPSSILSTTLSGNHRKPLASTKRNPKLLPSPLVPVNLISDSYASDNLQIPENLDHLALGFPLRNSLFGRYVVFLITYLTKFGDIVGFPYKFGPKDFEIGLGLNFEVGLETEPGSNTDNITDATNPETNMDSRLRLRLLLLLLLQVVVTAPPRVSKEMNDLFKKLLGLILNRKKHIQSHTKAIQELKPQTNKLGMPLEWKQYNSFDRPEYIVGSPVDPNHAEILINEYPIESEYVNTFNPFYDSDFENLGLDGLANPKDRLVMLHTLAMWSLNTSEVLKSYMTQNIQAQDMPGEKETYYGARAVLNGFNNCEHMKLRTVQRLSKMKSSQEDLKYVDPTSDPRNHSMNIRLVENIAGDLGFRGGIFYLCRSADEDAGGLSSVQKMSNVWKDSKTTLLGTCSDFKLYVHDIAQTLADSMPMSDVQVDENDNEKKVASNYTIDLDKNWYEVASNCTELQDFINYLDEKLSNELQTLKRTLFYKSVENLHNYLSGIFNLLQRHEEIASSARIKRRKVVDYSNNGAGNVFELAHEWFEDENKGEHDELDEQEYVDDELENDDALVEDANDEDDKDYLD
ncbi:hypothetical protein LELG_02444 [Lodderomyces elongisporus NRRL YB-4239]|uniref:WHIM1 domain-containing protein n=1 Tax=Lodderomyces elongisporus (strain ATCC 11503 / CBS 2605 / JCM 1781 / NBRC 1676 / NRRL YB-4239) TaxID=379508 RepID=A5DYK7_LODEL|nr:hypothetical protein LELG_02444 [Lodderomyces elongisporus NRRL YB-4239]